MLPFFLWAFLFLWNILDLSYCYQSPVKTITNRAKQWNRFAGINNSNCAFIGYWVVLQIYLNHYSAFSMSNMMKIENCFCLVYQCPHCWFDCPLVLVIHFTKCSEVIGNRVSLVDERCQGNVIDRAVIHI